MKRFNKFICWICMASVAALFGCGLGSRTVNVFAVYDDRTITCNQADEMVETLKKTDSMYRAARSKVNWCEIAGAGGVFVPVGRFDFENKVYVFERLDIQNGQHVRRLCLDIAVANGMVDTPPAELSFKTQVTIDGELETFPCDYFAGEMAKRAMTILIAPAHLPLLIDIDPVIILATGANPQLEGVPHHDYDEVRDLLEKSL